MKIALLLYCSLLLLITFLPLIKNEYWVFRVCEYPRLQKLVANIVALILLTFYSSSQDVVVLVFQGLMILNAGYLVYLIAPFTKLAKLQVLNVDTDIPENSIRLMIANVLQDNTNYKGCLNEISKANPDLVLLLETDSVWDKQTESLASEYAFQVKVPLDNKYGMLLYSKFPLKNTAVHYMVEDDIPSIHTEVALESGQSIQLYAVHPTPPVPNENPTSRERDKELLLVADLVQKSELPVIVIGDLNDVAWSYTTELFLKMSGLLDPRRGRGFFNTFNAYYPFLRFPLDHAFISTDWKVKQIRRLENSGSDHFPIFISLQYEKQAVAEQKADTPDAADLKVAAEKKSQV
ncbi:endonuclease/exonuclease/phosphatase family protein [Flavobacterium antarcticum]|uniref:endonuclease/exonuclease/phosphatase family protein n=1 Tax=Flavobacterium antarcticum TaxID=271155 RepID=UPI0003B74DEF|nr:endonuclease/exonuclease/phosphatase family protein [Flavobacterium antarcticum]